MNFDWEKWYLSLSNTYEQAAKSMIKYDEAFGKYLLNRAEECRQKFREYKS